MNKNFLFGLAVGMSIGLALSTAIFYIYVVRQINTAKMEARQNVVELKQYWKEELKEKTYQILGDQKDIFIKKIRQKIKDKTVVADTLLVKED